MSDNPSPAYRDAPRPQTASSKYNLDEKWVPRSEYHVRHHEEYVIKERYGSPRKTIPVSTTRISKYEQDTAISYYAEKNGILRSSSRIHPSPPRRNAESPQRRKRPATTVKKPVAPPIQYNPTMDTLVLDELSGSMKKVIKSAEPAILESVLKRVAETHVNSIPYLTLLDAAIRRKTVIEELKIAIMSKDVIRLQLAIDKAAGSAFTDWKFLEVQLLAKQELSELTFLQDGGLESRVAMESVLRCLAHLQSIVPKLSAKEALLIDPEPIPIEPEMKTAASSQSKTKLPCKFFFHKGLCKKGDECDFSHDGPTPPRRRKAQQGQ